MLFQERHKITRQYRTSIEGEATIFVPPVEKLTVEATLLDIAAQIELEDIDVTNTTVDVPIDEDADFGTDPAQMEAFGG
jgi:hypothetical protein